MKKKSILLFAIMLICFTISVNCVRAAGNGGSGGGGGSSSGGCATYSNQYHVCLDAGQFLAVKLRLMYYDASTNKMTKVTNSRPYYVLYSGTKNSIFEDKFADKHAGDGDFEFTNASNRDWFSYSGNVSNFSFGYNSGKILTGIMGTTTTEVYNVDSYNRATLNSWLRKLTAAGKKKITVAKLQRAIKGGKENCSITNPNSNNSGWSNDKKHSNCYGKSGYRIVIEPMTHIQTPSSPTNEMKNAYKNVFDSNMRTSSSVFLTMKQLSQISTAMSDVSWPFSGVSTANGWKMLGQAMYLKFSDIGVRRYGLTKTTGSGKNKKTEDIGGAGTFNCLRNSTFSSSNRECGYGYNIIDLSALINPPTVTYGCSNISGTDNCEVIEYEDGDEASDGTISVKSGSSYVSSFACNGQSSVTISENNKDKVVTLNPTCPSVTYGCQKTSTYGKCNIYRSVNGNNSNVATNVDCNSVYNNGQKYVAGGKTYTMAAGKHCEFYPKYNYDADIVCSGCDDEDTKDNLSYYIQDTPEWSAIVHSLQRNDFTTLQNYFKVTNNILCRNEYAVSMPKQSSVVTVPGRYFTVNKPGGNIFNGVYNFIPIKVTRIRECISNDQNALNNYSNISDFGAIRLKYEEKKYNTTQTLEAKRTVNLSKTITPSGISDYGYLRKDEASQYYELNDNVYRYVAIGKVTVESGTFEAGESSERKPTNDNGILDNKFKNLGTANLPVSVNNTGGATVKLNYQLPAGSGLKATVDSGQVDRLEKSPTDDSIYKSSKIGTYQAKTACAKMFGVGTAKYNSCVSQRNGTSKVAATTCLNAIKDSNNFNHYVCKLNSKDNGEPSCVRNSCQQILSTTDAPKYTCYNSLTQRSYVCDANEYYDLCGVGESGQNDAHICVIHGGEYWGQDGKKITGNNASIIYNQQCARTDETCKSECDAGYCCPGSKMTCPESDGNGGWTCRVTNTCGPNGDCDLEYMENKMKNKYGNTWEGKRFSCIEAGYCCPDAEMGCPACYDDNNNGKCEPDEWRCPPNNNDNTKLIYRTIDLNNPFPGQNASGRETGANWCYQTSTGEFSCDNENDDNSVANQQVKNQRVYTKIKNNRGVSGNEIYSIEPMYVFNLSASDIRNIRNYNKGKSYDDNLALNHDESDDSYTSSFFRNVGNSNLKTIDIASGTCMETSGLHRDVYGNIVCQGGNN